MIIFVDCSVKMKGEEMERIKQILDDRTLRRALLLLTVCTSCYATKRATGNVSFDYVKAVGNKDSQFTNTADINRDGKPDILAFKGGNGGFISWYEYPGFRHHIIKKGNFNAGRPMAADIDIAGPARKEPSGGAGTLFILIDPDLGDIPAD